MVRAGILFMVLVSPLSFARVEKATVRIDPVCRPLLEPVPRSRARILGELFAEGLNDDSKTIGYLGIAQINMENLVGRARLDIIDTDEYPFISQNHDNPFIKPFVIATPKDRTAALTSATESAHLGAIYFAIIQHLRSQHYDHNRVLYQYLPAVVAKIYAQRAREYKQQFDSSLQEVIEAIGSDDVGIPVGEGSGSRQQRRVAQFLSWIGGGANPDALVSMFAGLPSKGGYVLALDKKVLGKLHLEDGKLKINGDILLTDVLGIEPLGQTEYSFMAQFQSP